MGDSTTPILWPFWFSDGDQRGHRSHFQGKFNEVMSVFTWWGFGLLNMRLMASEKTSALAAIVNSVSC